MAAARARRQSTTHDGSRRRGRFVARVAALLAGALVAAPLTLVGIASPAAAAEYRQFKQVFTTNTNGEILMAANTLMTCNAATGATRRTCAEARAGTGSDLNNNDFTSMQFVDVDASADTFNSSSADLTVPDGGSVLWARLYWAGRTGSGGPNQSVALRDEAVLRVPGAAGYREVTADVDAVDVAVKDDYGTAYQAHLDVTAIVQAAGSGTYTVGNVQSSSDGTNQYAGWALVVAVSDPAAPARNLTIFDGFGSVSIGDALPTFTVSGFITPPNGDIRTSVGVVAYEGDRGYTGDQLQLNGTDLSDLSNPVGNSFNSSISRFGVDDGRRNPAFVNQLGFDADVFRVARPVVNNGDTSATITLTTSLDQYFPGVVTFATDLYDPTLLGNKSVTDVNDGPLRPGDVLRYTVPVSNIGLDTAADSRFFDAIPTGTSYVPESLAIDGVPVTDAQDDDAGYYDAAPRGHVVAHLGAGASAGGGGDIPITPELADAPHTVSFSVVVDADIPHGAQIVNGAAMTYRGKTTYASASSVSNVVTDVVTATPDAGENPPVATPHVLTFRPRPIERTLDIAVLDGDRDADGDTFSVKAVTDAAGGALTVNADGTVTYAPRDDFAGRDVFTYTIEDSTGLRSTASVQVVVVNDAPVAHDDTATTTGGTPVTIDVLDVDTDANGDQISVRSVTPTSTQGGTVTIAPDDGSVVYTPRPGFRGTDTFDYVVQDTRGGSDTATVTVTVANGLPVAQPDTYTVNAGGTVALDLLANDSDPDGDAIQIAGILPAPSHGAYSMAASGTGSYTPYLGFVGTDIFVYRVRDDQSPAGVSSPVTVTIIVNGRPVANGDTANVPTGSSDVVVPVLDNDTDPENGDLTVTVVTQPGQGSAVALDDGTVRYTPAAGWAGEDELTYRVTDAGGLSSTATVTVTTANTAPVAVDDVASVAKNGVLSGVPVLANDTDVNVAAGVPGQALTVTAASADNGATVNPHANSTLDVTPATGFVGTVTVTYTVTDGAGGTDVGTLTVEVANGAPSALPDGPVSLATGTSVLVDVLANDTDPNGDTLTLVPDGLGTPVDGDGTARGTVTIENGQVRYTPPTGWAGTVTFTYEVTDGDVTVAGSATVVVANAVPVAGDFTETTASGTPVVLDAIGNASDANIPGTDQQLTVTGAVADQGADVVLNNDGTLTLTPAPGFEGDVTVTYTVVDRAGGEDTGTITVTVANAAPVADDDSVTTAYGTPVDVDLPALASDANPGDTLVVISAGTPVDGDGNLRGAVTLTGGVATFTSQDGFSGTVTFPYVVSDGTDTATGTITVEVANANPVAVDDTATTATDAPITVDVLANDTDPNIPVTDQRLQVTGASADFGANVLVEDDGRLTVTPAAGFRGDVTVTYTIADGPDGAGTATGTLVVSVANAAPVAGDDGPVTIASSTSTLIDVLANDVDANPADVLAVVPASLSVPRDADGVVRGSAAIEGGQVRFSPTPGFAGTVTFTYAVSDATAADTATVTVVVANDAPVAVDDAATTATDTPITVDVLANDTDANIPGSTQELTVTTVTADNGATAGIGEDGRVTVTLATGFRGDVTVTYTVSDGAGGEDTGILVVSVANASPVVGDDGPVTTPTDTSVLVDVLANDSDANGDPLSVVPGSLTPPVDGDGTAQGTVTVEDGQVRYVPAPGFAGTVTFEYDVTDGTSTTTGTVSVTVANAAPVAVDDAATTATDTPITVDVLANDTDANIPGSSQELTVTTVTADNGATAGIGPDGRVTVTPAAGFRGDVTVTYTITDGPDGAGTATGTLVVSVANAAPVAGDDGPVTIASSTSTLIDVLANDIDANSADVLAVVPASLSVPRDADGVVRGSAAIEDGQVRFSPTPGFAGTVTFTYAVSDATAADTATVTVVVANDAPVAVDDTATTATDTPITVDVLANDTDPNIPGSTQELTVTTVTADNGATAGIGEDGRVTVTLATGFKGDVTVTYTVSDSAGGQDTGILVVSVANASPVVGDDGPVTTPTDTSVLIDVLANDADANGDPLSVVPGSLTAPVDGGGTAQGTVTVEDGQVRYVPAPGFAGTVTFEYDVTDATSTTTGTVSVTVANAAPVAVDDTATTATDTPITVDVLGNDTDPNIPGTDQRLQVTGATADQGATVTVEDDGRLTVTPATGFKGDVTVTYTVTDGAGGSDEGTLVVTVANAAPVVPSLDTVSTPYGTPVVVDVLTPATDANGDPLEVVEVRAPVDADGTPRGTVTLVDGVVTYTPPAGWSGTVTFEYDVSDGTDTTAGTASVTVGNGAPVVTPDSADGTAGSPVTIDVLANDSDPEGGPLTIVEVTQPESGTVEIVDGKLVYTPAPGFVGEATFTYTATDATGARTTTTVTVRVAAAPPVAAGGPLAVTGAQVAGLGAAALLLLLGGAVLVTVRRRRGSHVG
ncbi:tandem-95 repeat protein [Cellulomonas dongxiuzhuiae]|uniref:Tandem-95 repeat protein n=2 Tax=Cellulomonas dongxiuzhuiae TaxID=2819979 RepID=A0ABX8GKS1_9CELL|nr:Ig-like domain-containing protein [Cellulomonas dongxiuzhuiae]QWC15844.1 tandem-95 repeat protein [Cellulomonas dongxiuzhuiae]